MRSLKTWLLMSLVSSGAQVATAQLQLAPNSQQEYVFCGATKTISVAFHNPDNQPFDNEVHTRIFQTSSATVALLSENPWKRLQVPANETVLASAALDFPAVKAETKFVVQWLASTNFIGKTEVLVYPTNLLAELKPLLDGETLGVLDPNDELKPLLRQNGVAYADLGQATLEDFSGRLAILGPFRSRAQLPEDVVKRSKAMAKNGVAIVWLQPPPGPRDPLRPSYYSVSVGTNAIVVVQSGIVASLVENPLSQQRLLQLCRQVLHPEPTALPESNNQP